MKNKILFYSNSQKVLNYILKFPVKDFTEREIQKAVKISTSGTNYALRDLERAGLISRGKRGKIYFYVLNHKHPVNKQLKVLQIIIEIEPILKKLENLSSKIILFGSSSRGENTANSDIDLFIVSHNREEVENIIAKYHIKRKIQAVIRSNLTFNDMKQTDKEFYEQVVKGIVIWEKQSES